MNQLRKTRKASGLTQTQVAIELGVSQGTVAMWETGKSQPRVETLKKLAVLLDVTVDQLLDDGNDQWGA